MVAETRCARKLGCAAASSGSAFASPVWLSSLSRVLEGDPSPKHD